MKRLISMAIGGMTLMALCTTSSIAEDKLRQIVTQNGSVIYTNIWENTPGPAAAIPTANVPRTVSDSINALVEVISQNHGVDPALVRAMIKAESNYNRWAVSPKGARGLMQLIPETGARYGVRDFFDPEQNIEGGVKYIKVLLGKFNGNLDLSLAAYNAGENLVEKLGRIPSIQETRDYVRKVRANYGKGTNSVAAGAASEAATKVAASPKQQLFRTVDDRGVIHFSNIAPPR